MDGIMKAAEHTMQPYSAASLKMGVTAIQADAANASSTRVAWSFPYNGYPVQACNALKSMPAANMITKGNSAILVEAEYTYKPILSSLVPGFNAAIKWTDTIAHAPRGRCPNYAGKNCNSVPVIIPFFRKLPKKTPLKTGDALSGMALIRFDRHSKRPPSYKT